MSVSNRTDTTGMGGGRSLDISLDLNTTRSSLPGQLSSRHRDQPTYTVKRVCANFSMDNPHALRTNVKLWKRKPDRQGFELTSMDTLSQMEAITSTRTPKDSKISDQSRSKTKIHHLPSMLLPTAKPQTRDSFADFVNGLRKNSVIPNTPTAPLILAANLNSTSHSLDSLRTIPSSATTLRKQIHSVPSSLHLNESSMQSEEKENYHNERTMSVLSHSSISSISSSGDASPLGVPPPSFIETAQQNSKMYLDNFADGNVAEFRWAMLRTRILAKEQRKALARQERERKGNAEHAEGIDCPVCAAAAQKFGGGKEFVSWLLDKWKPASGSTRETPDLAAPPQHHSHLGNPKVTPHFCNFVRKVRLREKDNTTPTPDHSHAHAHSASADTRRPASVSSVSVVTSSRKRPSSAWSAVERVGAENSIAEDQSVFDDRASTGSDWPTDVVESEWPSHPLDAVIDANTKPPHPPHSPSSPQPDTESLTSRRPLTPGSPTPSSHSHGSQCRAEIRIPTPRPESPADRHVTGDDASTMKDPCEDSGSQDAGSNRPVVQVPDLPDFKHFSAKQHVGPDQHVNKPQDPDASERDKKKRSINKKERKEVERRRHQRSVEEEDPAKMEETPDAPPPDPEPTPKPMVVPEPPKPKVVEAPALPTAKKQEKAANNRMKVRGGRMAVPIELPPERKRLEQTEAQADARKAFELNLPDMASEEVVVPKPRVSPWLHGRLALSQQASRFELPMDIKLLEKISACDYLKKYCIITTRRHTLYQKIHGRYRDKTGKISAKDLERALKDVLINSITSADVKRICEVVGLNPDDGVEYKLFAGIASVAERMLYPKFLTEDTQDIAEFKKEVIESADFNCLDWKLHGLNVNPQIRNIFQVL